MMGAADGVSVAEGRPTVGLRPGRSQTSDVEQPAPTELAESYVGKEGCLGDGTGYCVESLRSVPSCCHKIPTTFFIGNSLG